MLTKALIVCVVKIERDESKLHLHNNPCRGKGSRSYIGFWASSGTLTSPRRDK